MANFTVYNTSLQVQYILHVLLNDGLVKFIQSQVAQDVFFPSSSNSLPYMR